MDIVIMRFPTQAVEEEDKMTPEQLAIKNVGKQVKFYVNLFTMCRLILMSLNLLDMATNCRKKIFL